MAERPSIPTRQCGAVIDFPALLPPEPPSETVLPKAGQFGVEDSRAAEVARSGWAAYVRVRFDDASVALHPSVVKTMTSWLMNREPLVLQHRDSLVRLVFAIEDDSADSLALVESVGQAAARVLMQGDPNRVDAYIGFTGPLAAHASTERPVLRLAEASETH